MLEIDVDSTEDSSVCRGKGRVSERNRVTRTTVKASEFIGCVCSFFPYLLGQPSEASTKKSVLESDFDSTKDSSVGRWKGRVSERNRATRTTVKASEFIGCVC